MRRGENMQFINGTNNIAGKRVEIVEPINFIPEKLNADGKFFIGGNDVNRVTLHTENSATKSDIVAVILDFHQEFNELVTVELIPYPEKN